MDIKWKIWYDGGGTYCDEDGPPEDAPCRGVLIIAQYDNHTNYSFCRSNDFYIFSEKMGGWQGVDWFGLFDYLIEPGFKIVKFGRTVDNREYMDIIHKAMHDPALGHKGSWHKWEHKP